MKTATARKLCGQCEAGWVYDESTDPATVTRCPCMDREPSPQQARTAALNETAAAHPRQMDAAVRIIRDAAERLDTLSANDVRDRFTHAQISGPVAGAAFKKAESPVHKYIEATDRTVMSTDPRTRHRVSVWRSLIFTGQTARDGAA